VAALIRRDDLRVLRNRSFLRVFSARTGSVLGNAISPVALAFAVLEMPGGSATRLGLVLLVRQLAQIVLLLFGGVIADRLPRNRVMVASDLLAAAAQAGLAAVFLSNTSNFALVLVLAAVTGAAPALFIPASTGLIPQIVDKGQLQSANALLRFSMNSSMIVGAAIAGVLTATIGPGWALGLDAATFLFSAVFLAGIRLPRPEALPTTSKLADLRTGWREFTSRQWLWVIVLQFSLANACYNGGINVLGPLVAQTRLGGVVAWSVFSVARAVGLVAGSLVAMRLRPRYPLRVATYATFGFVPAFVAWAMGAPIWVLAVTALLIGVSLDIFSVLWDTALQTHVPQESLSKVSAYDALGSVALGPLGLAAAGPAADAFGATNALLVGGTLCAATSLGALASPSVRSLTATAPAVESPPEATPAVPAPLGPDPIEAGERVEK
jgi:MFS family permease